MDDNAKHTSSYQLDQEILDARGINMTVDEVAGLPTVKYTERVQSLRLGHDDLTFLKGLRRRIKNRLASQNSRRRNLEHLRRLTRELRAVRACRDDALSERRVLIAQRDTERERCRRLREYVVQVLEERSDTTEVPSVKLDRISNLTKTIESQQKASKETLTHKKVDVKPSTLLETINRDSLDTNSNRTLAGMTEKHIFECRIDKLVQQSVNHMYRTEKQDKKKICAKTIFIPEKSCIMHTSNVKSMVMSDDGDIKSVYGDDSMEVLNLSVREGRRKSHGRKQSAPRKIPLACFDNDDCVLDLKIKKGTQ